METSEQQSSQANSQPPICTDEGSMDSIASDGSTSVNQPPLYNDNNNDNNNNNNNTNLSSDHHSSEEELEVINNSVSGQKKHPSDDQDEQHVVGKDNTDDDDDDDGGVGTKVIPRCTSALPEKRKWCEVDIKCGAWSPVVSVDSCSSSSRKNCCHNYKPVILEPSKLALALNRNDNAEQSIPAVSTPSPIVINKCRMILRPHVRNLANPSPTATVVTTNSSGQNTNNNNNNNNNNNIGNGDKFRTVMSTEGGLDYEPFDRFATNPCAAFTPIVTSPLNFGGRASPSTSPLLCCSRQAASSSCGSLESSAWDCTATLPRKRHRRAICQSDTVVNNTESIQRPCLDFEKMQQMKANANSSITTWRNCGADQSGELSLYCW